MYESQVADYHVYVRTLLNTPQLNTLSVLAVETADGEGLSLEHCHQKGLFVSPERF